ncbi:MAG: hypothetical protein O3C60_00115 [Planctomycetota bacterium]|nr:hypothetical protein [Planctomycetota bacterium]
MRMQFHETIVVWVIIFGGFATDAYCAEAGADQVMRLVIDAFEGNEARIQSVTGVIQEVSKDTSVKEVQVSEVRLSEGRIARITQRPHQDTELQFTLKGPQQKIIRLFKSGDAVRSREEHLFRDGRWTQYVPSLPAAWINGIHQGPGTFPLDPRQVGSVQVGQTLVDCLRREKLISAELKQDQEGGPTIFMLTSDAVGEKVTRQFAASCDFLPTRWETHWPDGSVLQSIPYEYESIVDGKARFPRLIRRRFYEKGVARDASSDQWRQQVVRKITIQSVNQPIPSETFAIEFSPGTRVTDNVKGAIYKATIHPTLTSPTRGRLGVIFTVALMIVLIGVRMSRQSVSSFPVGSDFRKENV